MGSNKMVRFSKVGKLFRIINSTPQLNAFDITTSIAAEPAWSVKRSGHDLGAGEIAVWSGSIATWIKHGTIVMVIKENEARRSSDGPFKTYLTILHRRSLVDISPAAIKQIEENEYDN